MNHCTLIALIFCITICHSVASTDHGPLCPGLVRTIRTTVRHGYDQEPKNWELFTFRGEVGQKISIAVRRTRPAMDPFLALFSPTGALLASNDDAVEDCCNGPNGDPQIDNFVLNTHGIFTVGVADWDGSDNGVLEFTIVIHGSTACCDGSRCMSSNTYARCDNHWQQPVQTCQAGLICCQAGENVYCVRPHECPSCATCVKEGNQKCVSDTTYATCDDAINGVLYYQAPQSCQPGLVCCPSGDHVYCVRPNECPLRT